MELEFWKPIRSSNQMKATVHLNGNLGFSSGATENLKINEKKYVKIGFNKSDKKDKHLYMLVVENNCDECLRINKAGNYFYLNTTLFFNELGIEYKKKKIIFDIVEIDSKFGKLCKLIKREVDRKKK